MIQLHLTGERSYLPGAVYIFDPNQECRDYKLDGESPLAGLLDNPWYPPYVEDRRHYHNCMEIGVCLSGTGRIEIGRQAWDFTDGAVTVVGRGLHHSQQNTGEPMTYWRYVLVDEELVLREAPARHRATLMKLFAAARKQGLFIDSGDGFQEIHILLRSMFELFKSRQEAARMELEAMVHLLLLLLSRTRNPVALLETADKKPRRAIEPALSYISENYTQEIRVSQLAASCAMSESYFRKVFLAIMDMPPLEYLNRYRINRSINLLWTTDATFLQIAIQTGFSSVAAYNRNFRRYVGKSPAQWRKKFHNTI